MKIPSLFLPRALALLLGALAATGCTPQVSENERPCPCAEGWTCCAQAQVCVADAAQCERLASQGPDTTPPVPPQLIASVPASPSNRRDVQLDALSEAGARVEVFAEAACEGAPAGSAVADAAGAVRIPVALAENTTTRFHARATDAAGNTSLCSALPLEVLHDGAPPLAPAWAEASSAFTLGVLQPLLSGVAEPGMEVLLFADAACTRPLPVSARADVVGAFQVRVTLTADSLTRFFARARDAAGNTSGCSTGLEVRHDGQPPAPPAWSGTTPASPSRERAFTLAGTTEARARVRLYAEAACAGTLHAEVQAGTDGAFRFNLEVPAGGTLAASATAADAVGNTSACVEAPVYTHDEGAPTAPTELAMVPASLGNVRRPRVRGAAEPGTSVRVWRGMACTGTPQATAKADENGAFTAEVEALADAESRFVAQATDVAGNVSACSGSIFYIHDGMPPEPPVLITTATPSPYLHAAGPPVLARAEIGSHVTVFSQPGCQGESWTQTSGTWYGGTSSHYVVDTGVPGQGTRQFSARAVDRAGNTSACTVTTLPWTYAPTGPGWDVSRTLDGGTPVDLELEGEGAARALLVSQGADGGTVLSTRTALPGSNFGGPEVLAEAPNLSGAMLAVGTGGETSVAWYAYAADGGQMYFRQRDEEAGWTEPTAVPGAGVNWPMLAVGDEGHTFLAGSTYDAGVFQLRVHRHVPGTGWETPQDFPTATGAMRIRRLVPTPGGGAELAWTHEEATHLRAWTAHFEPGQGWSAPTQLSAAVLSTVELDVDASGRALALWQERLPQGTGYRVLFSTRAPGEAWTAAQPLPGAAGGTDELSLDVNAAGEALATWVENRVDNHTAVAVHVSRYTPGTGWSPPAAVPALTPISRKVRGVMLPDGNGLVFTRPGDALPVVTFVDATGRPATTGYLGRDHTAYDFLVATNARGHLLTLWAPWPGYSTATPPPFSMRWWHPAY